MKFEIITMMVLWPADKTATLNGQLTKVHKKASARIISMLLVRPLRGFRPQQLTCLPAGPFS